MPLLLKQFCGFIGQFDRGLLCRLSAHSCGSILKEHTRTQSANDQLQEVVPELIMEFPSHGLTSQLGKLSVAPFFMQPHRKAFSPSTRCPLTCMCVYWALQFSEELLSAGKWIIDFTRPMMLTQILSGQRRVTSSSQLVGSIRSPAWRTRKAPTHSM